MQGDFTRDTFDPDRHFSRVLMQQGRVQLDADWNEQISILLHTFRTYARDIFGAHGGPKESGFEITSSDQDFFIDRGRYYVAGVLVENNERTAYSKQPGFPFADSLLAKDILKPGNVLFYLDVWERHVTLIDEPSICEVALNGADTATRAQVVWQVKAIVWNNDNKTSLEDSGFFHALTEANLTSPGTGRLKARVRRDKPFTDLCTINPESRFRGRENQLYRVEIHHSTPEKTTFKWSRENGSVLFPVESVTTINDSTLVKLTRVGRDTKLGLKEGDLVELLDEASIMGQHAYPMLEISAVDRYEMSITLKGSWKSIDIGLHAQLRRWDHIGDNSLDGAKEVVAKEWIELEDGVVVQFENNGTYRTGDYWLIPARVSTGDVEWPVKRDKNGKTLRDQDGNPIPESFPPHGPAHYYAPLALYQHEENKLIDCRRKLEL